MKRYLFIILTLLFLFNSCIGNLFASSAGYKFMDGLDTTAVGEHTSGPGGGTQINHGAGYSDADMSEDAIFDAIGGVVGMLLGLIGVFFLILMIYGGIIWMIARGNESEVQKAKNIIINAGIGLIVVLAAYAVTAFIGVMSGSMGTGVETGATEETSG